MADEKRLIDAKPLMQNGWHLVKIGESNRFLGSLSLADIPTVDAVEVVRCKDCKHYDNSEGICWCHLNSKFFPGGLDWHGFPEDGFCSYGERKGGEADA